MVFSSSRLVPSIVLVAGASCILASVGGSRVSCAFDDYGNELDMFSNSPNGDSYIRLINGRGNQCDNVHQIRALQNQQPGACADHCHAEAGCTHFSVYNPNGATTCKLFRKCDALTYWNSDLKSSTYAIITTYCQQLHQSTTTCAEAGNDICSSCLHTGSGFLLRSQSPDGDCLDVPAFCEVPDISSGVASWSGSSSCNSSARNIVSDDRCDIISTSGYTCTSPGKCLATSAYTGTFESIGECRPLAVCTVTEIIAGFQSWTTTQGSHNDKEECSSGSVLEGTSCSIKEADGYSCTSPGSCLSTGAFERVGECKAVCTVPEIPEGVQSWTGCERGGSSLEGTTCEVSATPGFSCTSPGVCGPNGVFERDGQCSSLAKPTTTLPAEETLPAEAIEFSLTLNVSNAEEFVNEPEVETVIQEAMAALLGVNASWIQNIRIVLLRRLASDNFLKSQETAAWSSRELEGDFATNVGGVDIFFDVVVPPDGGPDAITASFIMEEFDSKSLSEASDVVNQILKSGALGSKNYELTILVKKGTIKTESTPTPAPSPSNELPIFTVAMAAAGGCTCILATLLVICWKKRLRDRRSEEARSLLPGDRVSFAEMELLFPPQVISADCHRSISKFILSMSDYCSPVVFVCFVTRLRKAGTSVCDPSFYYAGVVIRALQEQGISCCSSLPPETGKEDSLEVLCRKSSSCKIFLLLDTHNVHKCRECLHQLYSAQKKGMHITRLQFERDPLLAEKQWVNLPSDDLEGLEMREAVIRSLPTHVVLPEGGEIVQSVPGFLEGFALDVSRKLQSIDSFTTMLVSGGGIDVEKEPDIFRSQETVSTLNSPPSERRPKDDRKLKDERKRQKKLSGESNTIVGKAESMRKKVAQYESRVASPASSSSPKEKKQRAWERSATQEPISPVRSEKGKKRMSPRAYSSDSARIKKKTTS